MASCKFSLLAAILSGIKPIKPHQKWWGYFISQKIPSHGTLPHHYTILRTVQTLSKIVSSHYLRCLNKNEKQIEFEGEDTA